MSTFKTTGKGSGSMPTKPFHALEHQDLLQLNASQKTPDKEALYTYLYGKTLQIFTVLGSGGEEIDTLVEKKIRRYILRGLSLMQKASDARLREYADTNYAVSGPIDEALLQIAAARIGVSLTNNADISPLLLMVCIAFGSQPQKVLKEPLRTKIYTPTLTGELRCLSGMTVNTSVIDPKLFGYWRLLQSLFTGTASNGTVTIEEFLSESALPLSPMRFASNAPVQTYAHIPVTNIVRVFREYKLLCESTGMQNYRFGEWMLGSLLSGHEQTYVLEGEWVYRTLSRILGQSPTRMVGPLQSGGWADLYRILNVNEYCSSDGMESFSIALEKTEDPDDGLDIDAVEPPEGSMPGADGEDTEDPDFSANQQVRNRRKVMICRPRQRRDLTMI